MSMFQKALGAIGDFSNNLQLEASTSPLGRAWTEYVGIKPWNAVAKMEGAPLYGTRIPDSMIADSKKSALSHYTPLAQSMLKSIPIVMGDKALPNVDLKGYDASAPNAARMYSAATVDPYVPGLGDKNPPHQRQIVIPQEQFTGGGAQQLPSLLNYEYAHALANPMLPKYPKGEQMFLSDFEKMKKTNPDMYNSIKAGLAPFHDDTRVQMSEALSLGASRYGSQILDTPIGKYYKNILQPDKKANKNLFKNPVMDFILGRAGNITKDAVQGAISPALLKKAKDEIATANTLADPKQRQAYYADASKIAQQTAGNFSPDVKQNPIIRALLGASEIAGTAGTIAGVGNAVASKIAPHAAQKIAEQSAPGTIGAMQEASQRARGLGLLADYDVAARAGNNSLMTQIAQQIVNSPQGSPYEMYKTVFQHLAGL